MTLNSVIALISFFLLNFIALLANYVTVVEDRPIMSAKYCLPIAVFHFQPKLAHPAALSLCDS